MSETSKTTLIKPKAEQFPVMEIFGPTVQGEGPLCGHRSHFVRFGGCPYRCSWCDTMYAVDPQLVKANKKMMSADDITAALGGLRPSTWVTLTGGDPVMWDLYPLVSPSNADTYRYKWSVETEGALWQDWLYQVEQVVVSPKPPSSGMAHKFDGELFKRYVRLAQSAVKVVIFNEADFDWLMSTIKPLIPSDTPLYLSVGTTRIEHGVEGGDTGESYIKQRILTSLTWLTEKTLARDELRDAVVLPQMHVLTWGERRGV